MKKFLVVAAITFIILFLMNYIGNDQADKLERALMTAVAGVVAIPATLARSDRQSCPAVGAAGDPRGRRR